jgi:hypothetical protein
MAVSRRNILQSAAARDKFRQAVTQLKAEPLVRQGRQLTTADFGIRGLNGGRAQLMSTYDAFVLWHHQTMMTPTPPGGRRNAAHQGPVFLPWHRLMLLLLERNMQRVLNDPNFGLPYWDWAADGEGSVAQQMASPLWTDAYVGGNGDPAAQNRVTTGPFSDASGFRVRLWADSAARLWAVNRPLQRRFARMAQTRIGLPKKGAPAGYVGPKQPRSRSGSRFCAGFSVRRNGADDSRSTSASGAPLAGARPPDGPGSTSRPATLRQLLAGALRVAGLMRTDPRNRQETPKFSGSSRLSNPHGAQRIPQSCSSPTNAPSKSAPPPAPGWRYCC